MDSEEAGPFVGQEARKMVQKRDKAGFNAKYLSGSAILDIGYRGYVEDVVPIVPAAVGVELDYPGYDGLTLPFATESQDAVFASHCLEHIADFRNAISDWFRVLRIGGFLVIMVPHQFLYEKKTGMPSRFNEDHKRFYTPASLMSEIELSLKPNTYRLRHLVDNDEGFDYDLPPSRHSGGSYEIEVVVEKIQAPAWELSEPPPYHTGREAGRSPAAERAEAGRELAKPGSIRPGTLELPLAGGIHPVLTYDFAARAGSDARILVMKLDHLGDFIIGLPALQRLRAAFPAGQVRLVVGSWNRLAAEASGIADEVVTYDYFPQNALGWNGTPVEPIAKFRELTAGKFDLAIDLRVDDDTRRLLALVDARVRCGVGLKARFPFLDVAMPPEHKDRGWSADVQHGQHFLGLDQFDSRMPVKTRFYHETSFAADPVHMIYGPGITLPLGTFMAAFDLQLTGWTAGLRRASVTLDIARDEKIVAIQRFGIPALRRRAHEVAELQFTNDDLAARYEFRVFVEGGANRAGVRFGGVRFGGVRLHHEQAPVTARLRRAELHIGEQLSLLVQLAADRVRLLYSGLERMPGVKRSGKHVLVAPLSNSDLRDWPSQHYVELIRMLLERGGCLVSLVGAPQQGAALDDMMRRAGGGERVVNLAGLTAWSEMPGMLRDADLVICNNSGIAHAAAAAGAETLAIYSASHQPQEWGPRGERSHAMMAVVPCSPCGFDKLKDCPHEHTCMVGLSPATVFSAASRLLQGAERIGTAP